MPNQPFQQDVVRPTAKLDQNLDAIPAGTTRVITRVNRDITDVDAWVNKVDTTSAVSQPYAGVHGEVFALKADGAFPLTQTVTGGLTFDGGATSYEIQPNATCVFVRRDDVVYPLFCTTPPACTRLDDVVLPSEFTSGSILTYTFDAPTYVSGGHDKIVLTVNFTDTAHDLIDFAIPTNDREEFIAAIEGQSNKDRMFNVISKADTAQGWIVTLEVAANGGSIAGFVGGSTAGTTAPTGGGNQMSQISSGQTFDRVYAAFSCVNAEGVRTYVGVENPQTTSPDTDPDIIWTDAEFAALQTATAATLFEFSVRVKTKEERDQLAAKLKPGEFYRYTLRNTDGIYPQGTYEIDHNGIHHGPIELSGEATVYYEGEEAARIASGFTDTVVNPVRQMLFTGATDDVVLPDVVTDQSGNGNNATITGHSVLEFDGNLANHVDTGEGMEWIANSMDWTFETYFKLDALVRAGLVGHGATGGARGFALIYEANLSGIVQSLRVYISKGSGGPVIDCNCGNGTVTDLLWHHIKITATPAGVVTFVLDGVTLTTAYLTTLGTLSTGVMPRNLRLGSAGDVLPLDGRLSDIKFGSSAGLTYYYPGAEVDGNDVYNKVGGEGHGTIVGTVGRPLDLTGGPMHNLEDGFRKEGTVYIPSRIDGLVAANGLPITNPAGGHNDAESPVSLDGAGGDLWRPSDGQPTGNRYFTSPSGPLFDFS